MTRGIDEEMLTIPSVTKMKHLSKSKNSRRPSPAAATPKDAIKEFVYAEDGEQEDLLNEEADREFEKMEKEI